MPKIEVCALAPNPEKAKNILFLSEGFSENDRALFDWTVYEITERFFRSAPFNLRSMQGKFNIFRAFKPSDDGSSGISCPDYLIIKNETEKKFEFVLYETENPISLKESPFGFMCSFAKREFAFESKRINEFVSALLFDGSNIIPRCWLDNDITGPGRDRGMICFLLNDDIWFRRAYPNYPLEDKKREVPFCVVSLSAKKNFNLYKKEEIGNKTWWDHEPDEKARDHTSVLSNVFIHEICHSHFLLGDEYEGVDPWDWMPQVTNAETADNRYPNITVYDAIKDSTGEIGSGVDPGKVKWIDELELYPGAFEDFGRDLGRIVPEIVRKSIRDIGPLDQDTPPPDEYNRQRYTGTSYPEYPREELQNKFKDMTTLSYYVVNPQRLVGLYEGAYYHQNRFYRPAGICKMRATSITTDSGRTLGSNDELCYICQREIVERTAQDLNLGDAERKEMLIELAVQSDPLWAWRKAQLKKKP